MSWKILFDLVRRALIALGWLQDAQVREDGRRDGLEAVRKVRKDSTAKRAGDNSGRVRDDDADLFRD